MAKAKMPAASTDDLVHQALLTVATADGPPRLAGKGDTPALFASKTGANKTVIDALTGLATVTGKGADESVRLTAAGFNKVAAQIPEERLGAAAKVVAADLTTTEKVAFLQDIVSRSPVAAAELLTEYEAAVAAEKIEAETRLQEAARRREREERAERAMVRWLELGRERKQQRIATLLAELQAEGGTAPPERETPTLPRPEEPRLFVRPTTTADGDFRRDVAERLVSSWRDAVQMRKDEARQFLETALDNIVGVRRIGEEGDQMPFDGTLHEAVPGVSADHPVRVTRSGWALEVDDDREYVIERAQVAK